MLRIRTFGLLLLAGVGVVPLLMYGVLATERAERAAIHEVQVANQRIAETVADRIGDYVAKERDLLGAIGAAVLQAPELRAQNVLETYMLEHKNIIEATVARTGGTVVAQAESFESSISHVETVRVPVMLAGSDAGYVEARVDLVDLWPIVNDVRVGETGFARLIDHEGRLFAHGHPEERRFVFRGNPDTDRAILAAAQEGEIVENYQGVDILASAAPIPSIGWTVVVERETSEAFAGAEKMRQELYMAGGGVLVVVILLGLAFGRSMVRPLEKLRAHTKVIARGDLEARAEADTRIVEIKDLAGSLDEMADDLAELQDRLRSRERLDTFARVAAGLAHDIRHPIESVRAACGDLLMDPSDDGAMAHLRTVSERDLPRLKAYMEDLQRMASRGTLNLNLERFQPGVLAREIAEEISTADKFRECEFEVSGDAGAIEGDRDLIRRAVSNLARNAAEACIPLGIRGNVTIDVTESDDAVQLSVSDTGPGIPPERVREILSSDFRSSKRGTGIGLGLAVVRHVAEAHGGELTLSSEVGVGSTFTLVIPRSRPAAASDGVSEATDGKR